MAPNTNTNSKSISEKLLDVIENKYAINGTQPQPLVARNEHQTLLTALLDDLSDVINYSNVALKKLRVFQNSDPINTLNKVIGAINKIPSLSQPIEHIDLVSYYKNCIKTARSILEDKKDKLPANEFLEYKKAIKNLTKLLKVTPDINTNFKNLNKIQNSQALQALNKLIKPIDLFAYYQKYIETTRPILEDKKDKLPANEFSEYKKAIKNLTKLLEDTPDINTNFKILSEIQNSQALQTLNKLNKPQPTFFHWAIHLNYIQNDVITKLEPYKTTEKNKLKILQYESLFNNIVIEGRYDYVISRLNILIQNINKKYQLDFQLPDPNTDIAEYQYYFKNFMLTLQNLFPNDTFLTKSYKKGMDIINEFATCFFPKSKSLSSYEKYEKNSREFHENIYLAKINLEEEYKNRLSHIQINTSVSKVLLISNLITILMQHYAKALNSLKKNNLSEKNKIILKDKISAIEKTVCNALNIIKAPWGNLEAEKVAKELVRYKTNAITSLKNLLAECQKEQTELQNKKDDNPAFVILKEKIEDLKKNIINIAMTAQGSRINNLSDDSDITLSQKNELLDQSNNIIDERKLIEKTVNSFKLSVNTEPNELEEDIDAEAIQLNHKEYKAALHILKHLITDDKLGDKFASKLEKTEQIKNDVENFTTLQNEAEQLERQLTSKQKLIQDIEQQTFYQVVNLAEQYRVFSSKSNKKFEEKAKRNSANQKSPNEDKTTAEKIHTDLEYICKLLATLLDIEPASRSYLALEKALKNNTTDAFFAKILKEKGITIPEYNPFISLAKAAVLAINEKEQELVSQLERDKLLSISVPYQNVQDQLIAIRLIRELTPYISMNQSISSDVLVEFKYRLKQQFPDNEYSEDYKYPQRRTEILNRIKNYVIHYQENRKTLQISAYAELRKSFQKMIEYPWQMAFASLGNTLLLRDWFGINKSHRELIECMVSAGGREYLEYIFNKYFSVDTSSADFSRSNTEFNPDKIFAHLFKELQSLHHYMEKVDLSAAGILQDEKEERWLRRFKIAFNQTATKAGAPYSIRNDEDVTTNINNIKEKNKKYSHQIYRPHITHEKEAARRKKGYARFSGKTSAFLLALTQGGIAAAASATITGILTKIGLVLFGAGLLVGGPISFGIAGLFLVGGIIAYFKSHNPRTKKIASVLIFLGYSALMLFGLSLLAFAGPASAILWTLFAAGTISNYYLFKRAAQKTAVNLALKRFLSGLTPHQKTFARIGLVFVIITSVSLTAFTVISLYGVLLGAGVALSVTGIGALIVTAIVGVLVLTALFYSVIVGMLKLNKTPWQLLKDYIKKYFIDEDFAYRSTAGKIKHIMVCALRIIFLVVAIVLLALEVYVSVKAYTNSMANVILNGWNKFLEAIGGAIATSLSITYNVAHTIAKIIIYPFVSFMETLFAGEGILKAFTAFATSISRIKINGLSADSSVRKVIDVYKDLGIKITKRLGNHNRAKLGIEISTLTHDENLRRATVVLKESQASELTLATKNSSPENSRNTAAMVMRTLHHEKNWVRELAIQTDSEGFKKVLSKLSNTNIHTLTLQRMLVDDLNPLINAEPNSKQSFEKNHVTTLHLQEIKTVATNTLLSAGAERLINIQKLIIDNPVYLNEQLQSNSLAALSNLNTLHFSRITTKRLFVNNFNFKDTPAVRTLTLEKVNNNCATFLMDKLANCNITTLHLKNIPTETVQTIIDKLATTNTKVTHLILDELPPTVIDKLVERVKNDDANQAISYLAKIKSVFLKHPNQTYVKNGRKKLNEWSEMREQQIKNNQTTANPSSLKIQTESGIFKSLWDEFIHNPFLRLIPAIKSFFKMPIYTAVTLNSVSYGFQTAEESNHALASLGNIGESGEIISEAASVGFPTEERAEEIFKDNPVTVPSSVATKLREDLQQGNGAANVSAAKKIARINDTRLPSLVQINTFFSKPDKQVTEFKDSFVAAMDKTKTTTPSPGSSGN